MNSVLKHLAPALWTAAFLASPPEAATFEPVHAIADIPAAIHQSERIRGITIAPIEDGQLGPVGYGSERCRISVGEVADLGGTWISITPFGRMDDLMDTDILHDFEIPVKTNEDLIRETVRQARSRGLRVAIIPHLYVMNGEWRGDIDPGSEVAWTAWFDAYTDFVLRFARLAEEVSADLFSIGVEFKSSSNFHDDAWRQVIGRIRAVYHGPLTYSANWDEVDQVLFWDALDYIGVNAFWPLAQRPGDGYDIIRGTVETIADDLAGIAFYYDRPVLFTEMGIKSATDAALAPWEWPEHLTGQRYNEAYQAEAYDAVFDAISSRSWFAGLFIWKYFADPFDETQESREGFTPRFKKAESRLSHHFFRPWSRTFYPII